MMRWLFLCEEKSMRETLLWLLPKIKLNLTINDDDVVSFCGISDLKKGIIRYGNPQRWRGSVRQPSYLIIICDQDAANCKERKADMLKLYQSTGNDMPVLIRLACSELESWFLGDVEAVKKGLSIKTLASGQNQPTDEHQAKERLIALTAGRYHPSHAAAIAKHLTLSKNKSPSFQQFVRGIEKIAATPTLI